MTRAIYFANSTGPANTGDGQAIWYNNSKVTVNRVATRQLSTGFISFDNFTNVDKSAVAVDVTVAGKTFVVVNSHLCWSKCADSQGDIETTGYSAQRVAQIKELLSWTAATFPGKKIISAGDMNFTPNFLMKPSGKQIDLFLVDYVDLWAQGVDNGTAIANHGDRDQNGFPDMDIRAPRTADLRQVDFFFMSKGAGLIVSSIELLDLRFQCPHPLVPGGNLPACSPEVVRQWDIPCDFGVRPSDHNFLRLTLLL